MVLWPSSSCLTLFQMVYGSVGKSYVVLGADICTSGLVGGDKFYGISKPPPRRIQL